MRTSRIIYVSRATSRVDGTELADIAAAAGTRNDAVGVTGALLSCCGYFLQVPEGTAGALGDLMERIRRDPRHADLQLVARLDGADRLFSTESMACLHEAEMTLARFERSVACTRLTPAAGGVMPAGAPELLGELRAAIAAKSARIVQGAARTRGHAFCTHVFV